MHFLTDLKIKIFADGADVSAIRELYANPLIKGLTTNPTLMNKAGIKDYEAFARQILETVRTKPISFEVFSDDFSEMRRQALKIRSWQSNVFVKIPITNTRGESSVPLIHELGKEGVQLNVTAMLTTAQVTAVVGALNPEIASVISVFAGRIADTGRDPMPLMKENLTIVASLPRAELLWGSVREVLNIFHAEQCGSHIVTVPMEILKKVISLVGMDLAELSLDTVRMFERDARLAGFKL